MEVKDIYKYILYPKYFLLNITKVDSLFFGL